MCSREKQQAALACRGCVSVHHWLAVNLRLQANLGKAQQYG
jgi:hypothetical protein